MLLTECPQYIWKEEALHFSSVVQSCPTLCDPMDCSTPGFPVHHQHLGLAQIPVHRVGDAIQPPQLALASGSLGVCSRPLPWVPNSMHFESVSLLSLGPCAVESIGEPEYG